MRTVIEGQIDVHETEQRLNQVLPSGSSRRIFSEPIKKTVILVSKELHCLGDLLMRHQLGELKADVLAVISQFPDAQSLAEKFEIPFHCIPVHKGSERLDHENEILKVAQAYSPDYLILARYMRIFSAGFVTHFPERILNIHHSFLPAFIGRNPYEQAYGRGVKIIGATAHFVTVDLDQGPIICQQITSVDHSCDETMMAERGRDIERTTLAKAVNLVFENRVLVDGAKTIVFS